MGAAVLLVLAVCCVVVALRNVVGWPGPVCSRCVRLRRRRLPLKSRRDEREISSTPRLADSPTCLVDLRAVAVRRWPLAPGVETSCRRVDVVSTRSYRLLSMRNCCPTFPIDV